MAYVTQSTNSNSGNSGGNSGYEKAIAFVNLYRNGSKIGAMPMKESDVLQNRVATLIAEDNKEGMKAFLATLRFTFKEAKSNNNFGVEKAAAYINIGSELKSGNIKAISSIGLRESNVAHKEFINLIREDKEDELQELINEVEYNFVAVTPITEDDLGF